MPIISREVLVNHSAKQMFDLVNGIDQYKDFLPWCSRSQVLERKDNVLLAVLEISYMRIKQPFTTQNLNIDGNRIEMSLVEGPFKHLKGYWQFKQIGDLGCKIQFRLNYSFSSKILEKLIGAVFEKIMSSLVDSFIQEANQRYR